MVSFVDACDENKQTVMKDYIMKTKNTKYEEATPRSSRESNAAKTRRCFSASNVSVYVRGSATSTLCPSSSTAKHRSNVLNCQKIEGVSTKCLCVYA